MGKILFENGCLQICDRNQKIELPSEEIETVFECRMEDSIHHGDELFFILILPQEFIGIGPFVTGSAAIGILKTYQTTIKFQDALIRRIPYRYRKPSLMGLRLFPIIDICRGPLEDLQKFKLTAVER